jgi:hypothetical protein
MPTKFYHPILIRNCLCPQEQAHHLKTKAKKRGYIENTETDFNIKREIQLFKIGGQEIQL